MDATNSLDMYKSAYGDALARNTDIYNRVMSGYTNLMNQQQVAAANIGSNYDSVIRNVLGGLDQSGNTERQAIRDRYMANMGQAQQQLTNRGLGNTTVASAVGRGIGYDADKAYGAVSERVANQKAGYQTQLSLASLAEQSQANEMYNRLGTGMYSEMGQLGRVPLPDISPYLSYDAQIASINSRNNAGGGMNVIPSKGYGPPGTGYGPIAWGTSGGGADGGGYAPQYSSPVYGGTGNMGSAYGGGGDWGDPAATIPYSDDGWAYTEE